MKFRTSAPQERVGWFRGAFNVPRVVHLAAVTFMGISFALAGCGAFESRTQRITLSESGFLARVPETESQRAFYTALPPYRLYGGVKNGQAFYVYKDEKAGVIYVGNEKDYQHYMARVRRLIAFYETTEAKMVAYNIDNDLQRLWDGSLSH